MGYTFQPISDAMEYASINAPCIEGFDFNAILQPSPLIPLHSAAEQNTRLHEGPPAKPNAR